MRSFLSRVLVVVGLSVLMTLILMVIHWEPEPAVARDPVASTPPAAVAARPEPVLQLAADSGPQAREEQDEEVIGWVMRDVQEIDELPAGVRASLSGCVVPRSPGLPNVISGTFKQAGQTDLAVLCVRGLQATVYVFWAGAPSGAEIATEFDFIPRTYIRTAQLADIEVEVRRELPLEPGMPLRIRHDGIVLGNGCCATTKYWHRGRWRSYVSAD